MSKPIRVLIVDDSATMRELLSNILSEDPDIEVVGTAPDPLVTRKKIKALNPDVITLDVEMPRMDGLSFLERLMRLRPTPVIMISGLTQENSEATLNALEIGAVDVVAKSKINLDLSLHDKRAEIIDKVKAAAKANLGFSTRADGQSESPAIIPKAGYAADRKIIAIGASAGGVEALRYIVRQLPANCPPILITQHIAMEFSSNFAKRLNAISRAEIVEAESGMAVSPGHVCVAPGDRHLKLRVGRNGAICDLDDGPPVSGHRPSVDVLFSSLAEAVGAAAVGVILTGMGRDGAAGLRAMYDAGAMTIGQDRATAMIYGMPRVAFELGAVRQQLPLTKITEAFLNACIDK